MKRTAVVASLALTVGLGVSGPLPALAAPAPEPAAESSASGDKIEPALRDSFREDRTTEFWLRFEDRADLEPARSITDWTERGQFVYDALVETAETSLATVSAELDDAGVAYESFPIANAVLVEGGTEDLALELAANQQVAEVHDTPEIGLVEPVLPEPDAPAVRAAEADVDVEWGLDHINAPEAWEMGATGAGITVSNLDSGVQFDHPALVGSYRGTNADGTFDHDYNWFTTRGDCGDVPCDDNGHGTHTMGTMVGDDGAGNQVGVAPDAEWIATNGCCEETGFQTLLDSGWWLLAPTDRNGENPDVSRRPHVVNNSWGSSAEHAFSDFFTAIDEAWTAAGIFSVWSSGNTVPAAACDTVSSPGAHPDAYSVGAFASNGVLAAFSRKGEGEDGVIKPEISAPGVGVRSAWPGNGYNTISGTSMAAPHVAGAVAALWSYDPTLVGQIEETRRLLAESAVDVDDTSCGGTAEFNNKYGEGRLDLVRLLQLAPREGGTLTGVVTDDGGPVAGAEVTIDGPFHRTVGTTQDGTFSVHLPEGDYELTTTAFGYLDSTTSATVTVGGNTDVGIALAVAPTRDVSGTVLGEEGQPVPEAEVSLGRTPLDAVRTGDDGRFTLAEVPEGEYALEVRPNACLAPVTVPLTVGPATEPVEITVPRVVDEGGYTCTVSEGEYRRGTDKVEFPSGVWARVPLPSPIALYNGTHETLGIGLRGVISVDDSWAGPGTGGAGVFPFYTQSPLRARGDGSGVYTASTTVDGDDAFVVEYRDMVVWGGSNWPRESDGTVSFSTTFTRSGTVIVAYGDGVGGSDPLTAGLVTTTGIQGWEGVDGIRFSENAPVLYDGLVVTYDLPDFGYVDATVVDRNDGLPVEGATVAISDDDGLVESLTTTSTGALRRQLPVGDYTMTVTAPDYVTETHEFSLGELYAETEVDARLATGVADVATEGLDTVLGTDQHGAGSLTLTNTGSAPVTYELGEMARHPELDADDATARTGTGADSTIDLTAWNEAAARGHEPSAAEGRAKQNADTAAAGEPDEIGTHAGGDVITRIPIPGDADEKEPTGLGYDGDVWVHDYDARTNTAYTVSGRKTGKEFAAEWNPDYRAFDMAFDSRTGDMCQIEDSPASRIHCFDPDTGEKTREISGAWSNTQLTGLAYNAERDVFYVGGRGIGAIGTVAGTSHETPGEFLSYCSPPLPEVMGLAYNATSDTIWYSDLAVNRPSRLLQVDPVDCSLVNAWWFPGRLQRQGGGLATDATGALWATDQIADEVLLVDVEDDLTTDLPWLSLSATGGTLAPGESATVDVTLSADDVEPGVLGANIVVTSDAGRQSKQYVPVTLTTTEFQVGVNAGGSAYTDADGFAWEADRSFDEGSWGYRGWTRRATTHRAVAGTADDALFRSQRTTWRKDLHYEFDDVPEGTYLVELGFAEIEHAAPGRRVFDVLVNDSLEHYAYDAARMAGRNTADWRTAVVEHPGGPLTVELRGSLGLRPPSLAALRVTLDPRAAEDPEPAPEQPEPEEVPVAPADRAYTVTETTGLYRQGTTDTGWSGRFGCGVLWFGFDFPFYDTAWDGVCVAMNGMLTFDRSRTNATNTELPTRSPADAIYPFWDDLVVDDEAGIHIGVTTVDGLDAQIIEYRDVTFHDEPSERVSFSVTLVADGRIQLGYGEGFGGENPRTHGASATVGVERLDGLRAQQYSFDQPVLTAGTGIEYVLPASGTIEGEVTDANDGEPIAGAIVTLTDDDGFSRTITTNAQGLWKAQALVGDHTVEVRTPDYETVRDTVTVAVRGDAEVIDTALATGVAEISGDDLEWFLGPDGSASSELTVTNTGSAPLEVELTEQGRDDEGGRVPADLPWLEMSGDAADGTVELGVGDSTTVTVSVDNAGIDPGVQVGDVLVSSTAGRSPEQYRRARMATSAYWLGVDVGGRGLVDSDGFVWSADRALRPGSGGWGYDGGVKRSTRAGIDGTEDDELFRTQRTGRTFSYVFEDAPEGGYRIALGFAELSRIGPGARTFDVLVNGEVVLYEYDARAEAGVLTADEHSATVEHPGGDLTVELIGETGKRHPILSSLAVLEDPRL
ncbi:S8 family serine peptidase [Myceligenerans pegani]|uniref:alpha-amylase n=1 Tax=Myceligenerans pegani TaxID=2776917 RepID=A0ABR9N0S0_9MICO|nr:S8 family serine peptidase [Myceligenerans sp. TRM 65318]MBE1876668.1 carboxypeptidase regulatory-like domain-containing protein [Myceligenerans sp. TRM 65318]MBE3018939.1 carboxypeptidase regulatory-like domain-containing protein [Myceligenerans sp. TRM 65318]